MTRVIHARPVYSIALLIGTLGALSGCRGGDARQAEIDALRDELVAVKEAQAGMQKSLAALEQAAQRPFQKARAAKAGGPRREAVFLIPISFAPRKGEPITAVTVVEFADFQCPYCQAAAGLSDQLLQEFPGDVKFVFKHFPFGRHADAFKAATASWAALQQAKFWEMHDLIYGGSIDQLSTEKLREYAQKLGLDMARFDADMASVQAAQAVGFDKQLGRRMKVSGTPAYFVNGRRAADPSPATIRAMVAEEIAQSKQRTTE